MSWPKKESEWRMVVVWALLFFSCVVCVSLVVIAVSASKGLAWGLVTSFLLIAWVVLMFWLIGVISFTDE